MKSMRNRKSSNLPKYLLAICLATLLLVGGISFALYKNRQSDDTSGKTSEQIQQEKKQAEDVKEETARRDQKDDQPSDQNGTPQTLNVTINRASQMSFDGKTVASIRATVTGTTEGSCEVTFTKPGLTSIFKTFPITFSATSATCGAIDVPIDDFPAGGEWQIQIVTKGNNASSKPTTGQIVIQK